MFLIEDDKLKTRKSKDLHHRRCRQLKKCSEYRMALLEPLFQHHIHPRQGSAKPSSHQVVTRQPCSGRISYILERQKHGNPEDRRLTCGVKAEQYDPPPPPEKSMHCGIAPLARKPVTVRRPCIGKRQGGGSNLHFSFTDWHDIIYPREEEGPPPRSPIAYDGGDACFSFPAKEGLRWPHPCAQKP